MKEIFEAVPVIVTLLTGVYFICNYVFNVSSVEKMEKIQGFENRIVNVTLISCILLFFFGSYIGYLIGIKKLILPYIAIAFFIGIYFYMRKKEEPWNFFKSYWIQVIVYNFLPLCTGVIAGTYINYFIKPDVYMEQIAGLHLIMYLILLLSLILAVGRYRYMCFLNNSRVIIKIGDVEVSGKIIAEKSDEIYVEENGKIKRINKSEITIISQE